MQRTLDCYYEVRAQPNIEAGVLAMRILLLGDKTLQYGTKAGHPLCFLDDIIAI